MKACLPHQVVIARGESKANNMHLAEHPGKMPKLLSYTFGEGSYPTKDFKKEHISPIIFLKTVVQ